MSLVAILACSASSDCADLTITDLKASNEYRVTAQVYVDGDPAVGWAIRFSTDTNVGGLGFAEVGDDGIASLQLPLSGGVFDVRERENFDQAQILRATARRSLSCGSVEL